VFHGDAVLQQHFDDSSDDASTRSRTPRHGSNGSQTNGFQVNGSQVNGSQVTPQVIVTPPERIRRSSTPLSEDTADTVRQFAGLGFLSPLRQKTPQSQ